MSVWSIQSKKKRKSKWLQFDWKLRNERRKKTILKVFNSLNAAVVRNSGVDDERFAPFDESIFRVPPSMVAKDGVADD